MREWGLTLRQPATTEVDILIETTYSKTTGVRNEHRLNLMKKHFGLSVLLVGFIGILFFSTLRAPSQDSLFYVKADLGGNLTQDTDLKQFFGPVIPGSKVKFDPGVRFGLAGGYHVTDWFAAEAELGALANRIDSITGAVRVDAGFANVPFLVNARLQWPHECPCRLSPYIGGGVGGAASVLYADHIVLNGIRIDGTSSDAVFAYQAFGGLRFKLTDNMGLSLEYRYFATDSPTFGARRVGPGIFSDQIRFGGAQTHSLSLAFDFHF